MRGNSDCIRLWTLLSVILFVIERDCAVNEC